MPEIKLKSIFKTQLALATADSFYNDYKNKNFIFIGKITPWSEFENNLEIPIEQSKDTVQEDFLAWYNMLGCTPIIKKNISLVVKRNNWRYGNFYDQYEHDEEIFTSRNFYVLTSENNVYKCLSNNGGSASEYEPSGTSVEESIMPDGYIWKYLYTIREDLYRFLTPEYMPVEYLEAVNYTDDRQNQLNVQLTAIDGSIENIELVSVGSPYPYTIDEETDETNNENYVVGIENNSNNLWKIYLNNIEQLSMIDDFYNDYVLYISSGYLAGNAFTILEYYHNNGNPYVIVESNSFEDSTFTLENKPFFKLLPKVTITGDGFSAYAIARVDKVSKLITKFEILNPGIGYRFAEIKVKLYDVLTNSAKVETIGKVIISPYGGHGKNAIYDLLPKHVMICSSLREAQMEKIVKSNEFRQFGIVQNPLLNDGTERIAGTEIPEQLMVRVRNKTNTIEINFDFLLEETINILTRSDIVGKSIKQGLDTSVNQGKGIIKEFIQNSDNSGKLIITLISGEFYSSFIPYNMIIDLDDEVYEIDSPNSISGLAKFNYFTSNTFESGKKILGLTSGSTAAVYKSVITNSAGTYADLYLRDIKGEFIESYYNSMGELIDGEIIISYDDINTETGEFISISNIVESISYVVDSEKKTFEELIPNYKATTVLKITWEDPDIAPGFEKDMKVYQNIADDRTASGTVVSWTPNETEQTGELELVNVMNSFSMDVMDDIIRIEGDDSAIYAKLMQIIESDIIPYSGKITYIQNIRPVLKYSDQEEIVKILIGF